MHSLFESPIRFFETLMDVQISNSKFNILYFCAFLVLFYFPIEQFSVWEKNSSSRARKLINVQIRISRIVGLKKAFREKWKYNFPLKV